MCQLLGDFVLQTPYPYLTPPCYKILAAPLISIVIIIIMVA